MEARAEAQVLRLALIFGLLDCTNQIDVRHLRAALEVWRYCQDSVRYLFGDAVGSNDADAIFALLSSHPEGVSQTIINRTIFNSNDNAGARMK